MSVILTLASVFAAEIRLAMLTQDRVRVDLFLAKGTLPTVFRSSGLNSGAAVFALNRFGMDLLLAEGALSFILRHANYSFRPISL
jgi:hypothetical protein